MGTVPTTPTFTAGEKLPAAKLEQLCDVADFWANTPKCSVYQGTVATTMATGVASVVEFDAELFDIANTFDGGSDSPMHSTTTDPSRIYARTAGKYEISGQVMYASNATGQRVVQVRLNAAGAVGSGTQLIQTSQSPVSGASTSVAIAPKKVSLNAGDYIEVFASQSSGGSLASNTGQANTYFELALCGS